MRYRNLFINNVYSLLAILTLIFSFQNCAENKNSSNSSQDSSRTSVQSIKCELKVSSNDIKSGDSYTYTTTSSSPLPKDAKGFWNGTKNGLVDSTNIPYGQPDLAIWTTINNGNSSSASYTRSLTIKNGAGEVLCVTNTVQVLLRGSETNQVCHLTASSSVVGPSEPFSFSAQFDPPLPSGAQGFWYGTKNGITDAVAVAFGQPDLSIWTWINSGAVPGNYTRALEIRDSVGKSICFTNFTQVQLKGLQCTLSASSNHVGLNESIILTTQIVGEIPSDAKAFWDGTKNGVIDAIHAEYGQPDFHIWSAVNSGGLTGMYTRTLSIESSSGEVLCKSNPVSVTLD